MDTYGHMFPGQEADTVKRFYAVMDDGPSVMRVTGTADSHPQQYPQQLMREAVQPDATRCDDRIDNMDGVDGSKSLACAKMCERMRTMGAVGFEPT